MNLIGLIYLFTPFLAFAMSDDPQLEDESYLEERMISIESDLFESESFLEEELDAQEPGDLMMAREEEAFSDPHEIEPLSEDVAITEQIEHEKEESSFDLVISEELAGDVEVSQAIEPEAAELEVVPAAEKASSGQGGKTQAKDPRINSNRPRVTHREAPEQKSHQNQVVQEDAIVEEHEAVEDQTLGAREIQQVEIPVPQETAQGSALESTASEQPSVEKKTEAVQPRPAPRAAPQAKPKQNSGSSSSRPLNRNSVYQDEPVHERSNAVEEGEPKALSFKGEPNRVTLISRVKQGELRAAGQSLQRTVSLKRKKIHIARESAVAECKHRSLQAQQKERSSGKTMRQTDHPNKSHATVYTQVKAKEDAKS